MPTIGLMRDVRFRAHDTTPSHPEHSARLQAIEALLDETGLADACVALATRPAVDDEILRVHQPALLETLTAAHEAAQTERVFLDPDTVMSAHSLEAARLAAGGVVDASRALVRGELDAAFCLPRPPGHHATPDQAMGFCLINHIPIAAADLLQAVSVERIAIVDFDVHHGNGTQDIFIADPRVFYASTHQSPHYPGTGRIDELGLGEGVGSNCNLPLPPGCGDDEYLRCFDEVILPAVRRFRPQFLFVSAGFDAHWRDPLAGQQISGPGYRAIAERLRDLAAELDAPTLYMLEGGYDLEAIAWAVRHCVDVLLGNPPVADPVGAAPSVAAPSIDQLLAQARELHEL